MPRKSIQKSQPKDFESKRRNPISLGDDSNLDNDFKSLKIGDTPTGLEFKLGEIRSTADNFVTHKETTEELFVTRIKGNRAGDAYSPQILMQSPDPLANNYGLNINIFATGSTFLNATGSNASLYLESDGLQLYYIGDSSDNAFAWYYGSLGGSGTKLMQLDYEGELSLFSTADEGDYFKIAIGSAGATTISTTDNGGVEADLTLDVDGDIELNADGGTVEIKDGTASHFLFDCDATRFRIYDDTNASDFFTIVVGAEGATTISTLDADTAVGHLTLDADGTVILDGAGNNPIQIKQAGTLMAEFEGHHTATYLTLYENAGASTDDYMDIRCYASGATTIRTHDEAGADAHLTLDIDGDLLLEAPVFMKETDAAVTDRTANGQLWVKDTTPNELWFTDDTGIDTRITAGKGQIVRTIVCQISEAEMDALHTTEKVIVPAQGVGTVIIPISCTAFVDRDASTAQSTNASMWISGNGIVNAGWGFFKRFMRSESGDRIMTWSPTEPGENAQDDTTYDNEPLTAKTDIAITSGSIDSCKLVIAYYVLYKW